VNKIPAIDLNTLMKEDIEPFCVSVENVYDYKIGFEKLANQIAE